LQQQVALSTGLGELYRQLRACGGWKGPLPSEFNAGDPHIHSLLERLGVLNDHNEEDKDLAYEGFKLVPRADEVEVDWLIDSRSVSSPRPGLKLPTMDIAYSFSDFDSSTFGQYHPLPGPAGDQSNSVACIHWGCTNATFEHDWDCHQPLFLQLPNPEIQEPRTFDYFDLDLDLDLSHSRDSGRRTRSFLGQTL
jgi:hypothetical protein